jgi:phosphoglycolate phosphatase
MSIRLVIFDLDGTLVDTSVDITNALNYAILPLGLQALSVEKTTALVGEGLSKPVEKILGTEMQEYKDDVLNRFLHHYTSHLVEYSKPYPYVRDVLERLEGISKAVLSNKLEFLSRKLLEDLGLADYFDFIAGSDTASEKKPSPVPVYNILSILSVIPEEAALVGDSNLDVQAANDAGVMSIAVTYGYRSRSILKGADHIIDSLGDLIPLIHPDQRIPERRREKRHVVPSLCQKYLEFKMMIGKDYIPAAILDFSEHGLKLKCPVPLDPGSKRETTISVPKSLQKEISLSLGIRHCSEEHGYYIIGAEIEKVGSDLWFKVFRNILQFIKDREGDIF